MLKKQTQIGPTTMPASGLRFFALRMTVEPNIPGAVIPRRVFTRPGSQADFVPRPCQVRFAPESGRVARRDFTSARSQNCA